GRLKRDSNISRRAERAHHGRRVQRLPDRQIHTLRTDGDVVEQCPLSSLRPRGTTVEVAEEQLVDGEIRVLAVAIFDVRQLDAELTVQPAPEEAVRPPGRVHAVEELDRVPPASAQLEPGPFGVRASVEVAREP